MVNNDSLPKYDTLLLSDREQNPPTKGRPKLEHSLCDPKTAQLAWNQCCDLLIVPDLGRLFKGSRSGSSKMFRTQQNPDPTPIILNTLESVRKMSYSQSKRRINQHFKGTFHCIFSTIKPTKRRKRLIMYLFLWSRSRKKFRIQPDPDSQHCQEYIINQLILRIWYTGIVRAWCCRPRPSRTLRPVPGRSRASGKTPAGEGGVTKCSERTR